MNIERGGGRPESYKTSAGTKLPSVTTILSAMVPKPALVNWAYNQGKAGVPLYAERDKAGDIGTAVHDAVEEYEFSGTLPQFDELARDSIPKAVSAFNAYRQWRSFSSFEVIAMEVPLVSERLGYAGTPDMIAKRGDKLCLLDWKTSNAIYPEYLMQLVAYGSLWQDLRGQTFQGYEILRLSKDGDRFEHKEWTAEQLHESRVFTAWDMTLKLYGMQSGIKALLK